MELKEVIKLSFDLVSFVVDVITIIEALKQK